VAVIMALLVVVFFVEVVAFFVFLMSGKNNQPVWWPWQSLWLVAFWVFAFFCCGLAHTSVAFCSAIFVLQGCFMCHGVLLVLLCSFLCHGDFLCCSDFCVPRQHIVPQQCACAMAM